MRKTKYNEFYRFMKFFEKSMEVEQQLNDIGILLQPEKGILNLIDELISFIPTLIFSNPEKENNFWENFDYDFTDEGIEEFWNILTNTIEENEA